MRVYKKEFKEEAIKLSYEIGNKAASEQLGIPSTTLYIWKSQIKQHGSIAFVGSRNMRVDPKTAEIKAVEKRIKELEVANDILKRALGFFAESQKKYAVRELFQWIWIQKNRENTKHNIKIMCKVLHISEAGYYKWLKKHSNPYKYDDNISSTYFCFS